MTTAPPGAVVLFPPSPHFFVTCSSARRSAIAPGWVLTCTHSPEFVRLASGAHSGHLVLAVLMKSEAAWQCLQW